MEGRVLWGAVGLVFGIFISATSAIANPIVIPMLTDPPPYNASEVFPDPGWGQGDLAGDLGSALANQACGPAAAAYGLLYLSETYPSYSEALSGGELSAEQLASSTYMDTNDATGTDSYSFVYGLEDYMEKLTSHGLTPLEMEYTILTHENGQWGSVPDWMFIYNNLEDNQAVEIQIRYKDPDTGVNVGHYLLVTGISWPTEDSTSGTITAFDPATGSSLDLDINTGSHGILTTTYDDTTAAIVAEFDESPKTPEPSTISLVSLGAFGMLIISRAVSIHGCHLEVRTGPPPGTL